MIIDSSALIAVLMKEPGAAELVNILSETEYLRMSAANLTETLIVARHIGCQDEAVRLIDGLAIEILPVAAADAFRAAAAYRVWGRGYHRAALNFGDCFAYAAAKHHNEPLLFVGNDFAHTDLIAALPAKG